MKRSMKSLLTLALAALTGGLWAADPVATWTDFTGFNNNTLTSGDYTITKDDACTVNTDDSSITLGGNGLSIALAEGQEIYDNNMLTVVMDVSDVSSAGKIVDFISGNESVNLYYDGTQLKQRWAEKTNDFGAANWTPTRATIVLTYGAKGGVNETGTITYIDGTEVIKNGDLKFTSKTDGVKNISQITFPATTGMTIHSLYLYSTTLSALDVAGDYEGLSPAWVASFNGNHNAVGWFSGWSNGNELFDTFVDTPNGKGGKVESGNHPWNNTQIPSTFSVALYADVSSISNENAILFALGNKSKGVALVKTNSTTIKVVKIVENECTPVLECTNETLAIAGSYHLIAFGTDADGSFLCVDGTMIKGSTAVNDFNAGTQIGSLLHGLYSGSTKVVDLNQAYGMIVDEIRGYNAKLDDTDLAKLQVKYPECYTMVPYNFTGKTANTLYSFENDLVIPNDGTTFTATVAHTGGNLRVEIAGLKLIDEDDNEILGTTDDNEASFAGGQRKNNVYTFKNVTSGTYTLSAALWVNGGTTHNGNITLSNGVGFEGSLTSSTQGSITMPATRLEANGGNVTIPQGFTLTIEGAETETDATISKVLSGAGSLTIASGKVKLTAANTCTGGTTIAENATVKVDTGATAAFAENLEESAGVTVEGTLEFISSGMLYRSFSGDGKIAICGNVAINNTGNSGKLTGLSRFKGSVVVDEGKTLTLTFWNNGYDINLSEFEVNGSVTGNKGDTNATTLNLKTAKLSGKGTISGTDTFTLADGATIDATDGAVTVNGNVTVEGATVNVNGAANATVLTCANATDVAAKLTPSDTALMAVADGNNVVLKTILYTIVNGETSTDYVELPETIELPEGASLTFAEDVTPVTVTDTYGNVLTANESGVYTAPVEGDYVAQITVGENTTKYLTLQAAFAAAKDKDTIVLQNNVTLVSSNSNGAFEIEAGRALTLDLNGYNITAGARLGYENRTQYVFDNYADLTITGEGTITSRGIQNYAKLTINSEDVKIIACDTNGGACVWGYLDSTTIISAGVLENVAGNSGIINTVGALTITGGTFTQKGAGATYAIICGESAEATISDATIVGIHGVIAATGNAKVTIESGNYTLTGVGGQSDHCIYASGNATVIVNGGTFAGEHDAGGKTLYLDVAEDDDASITVSNGTFDEVVAEKYCADDFVCVKNEDDTYGVSDTCGATVNGLGYATFAAAFEAAEAGDTIKLLGDVTITSRLDIAQNVTIDLNGKTIAETMEDQFGAIYVKKGATLYVAATNGGEITTDGGIVIGNYGTVIVNGGTIAAGDDADTDVSIYNFYYQADWYGTTTINGGTVARIWNCGVATLAGGEVTNVDNSGAMEIAEEAAVTNILLRDGTDAPGIAGAGTLTAPEGLTITTVDGQVVVHADGKYTVVAAKAKIGETKYETIEAALDAANAGDTITLLADVTCTEKPVFSNGGIVNVDVNGHVFVSTEKARVRNVASADGTVPSNNIKFVSGFGWEVYSPNTTEGVNFRVFPTLDAVIAYEPAKPNPARIYPYENVKQDKDVVLRKYGHGTSSTICIDPGYDITWDLNGYTVLQESPTGNPLEACVRGKFTLKDSSDAQTGKRIAGACGVTDPNNKDWYGNGGPALYVLGEGEVILEGGTISIARNATLDKEGNEIVNSSGLIRVDGGKLNVNGATLQVDDTYGIMAWGGKVVVNGGIFDIDPEVSVPVYASGWYEDVAVEVNSFFAGALCLYGNNVAGYKGASATVNVPGIEYATGSVWFAPSVGEGLMAFGGFVLEEGVAVVTSATSVDSYATLAEALNAAETGDTITLIDNVTVNETAVVPAGKTITLNLDGHNITSTVTQGFAAVALTNNGNLTIEGEGTITGSYGAVYNGLGATLTINGGTYAVGYGFGLVNDGDATITGGTFEGIGTYNPGSITLNGGTVNVGTDPDDAASPEYALYFRPDFVGRYEGISVEINGGVINGNVYAYDGGVGTFESFDITGGTFNGEFVAPGNAEPNPPVISGGTFANPVAEEYCAEGYIPTDNGDGTYGVKVGSYVAQVGEAKYATLQDAVDAGGTVTLLADIELTTFVSITKSITLDLAGNSINRADGTALYVNADVAVTIQGEGSVSGDQAVYVNAGTVTIKSGNFHGYNGGHAVYVQGTGNAEILGGSFSIDKTGSYDYVLNKYDADRATTTISVKGGTFEGFNPENNAAEGANTNFCAEGYIAVADGDTYTVCEVVVPDVTSGNDTLSDAAKVAIARAAGGAEVTSVVVAEDNTANAATINGALELFEGIVDVDNAGVATVDWDFGITALTVNAEGKIVVTAEVTDGAGNDAAFAAGTTVAVFVDGNEVATDDVTVTPSGDRKTMTITLPLDGLDGNASEITVKARKNNN